MLSVRGQVDLQHYEGRLETVLGRAGYPIALEILTRTAVDGRLDDEAVGSYSAYFPGRSENGAPSVGHILHVLEHDGYLERRDGGYRFVSGLLEDWWRDRYGRNFVPAVAPGPQGGGAGR